MEGDGLKLAIYPECVRKSTMIRKFRASGGQRAIEEIEKVHAQFPGCPVHGKLEDPIIGVSDPEAGPMSQIAICCPWCSDPAWLELWEKEANLS